MKHLEAITCQWEGLKLVIFVTKYVSDKHLITYRKGSFCMPKNESQCVPFAILLAAMLSLKRRVFLNYKIEAREEEKYEELEKELLEELNGINLEEDIVTSDDWKTLSLKKYPRKEKEMLNNKLCIAL
ncbi:hypothetical protein BCV71DRAFT_272505 [Rhizopus microsporus]|uniref:Uncharacterized protein n=1 Tax=Rhizopus microsporus TaxID=58291 RepID=A0A1X0SCQ4_RHIZD|nr:hypothetical protein BCV71DRAFT_272505 [Rhizopus microsporus]